MQTLIVTGGAGFIGSSFVKLCVDQGHKVIVLDALTYAGHTANLEWISGKGEWELYEGDIGDTSLVSSLLDKYQPDAVVNFAAESHVDNSISSPGEFIETNIVGTYRLLECARHYWGALPKAQAAAFRYLQISTDEIYGSLELDSDEKFHEDFQVQPSSPYSASKAAGDHLVNAWHHTYGLPTLLTNCTNNYGPRQHPEKLIPHMIACGLAEKNLPVYGDGKNVRDWIHVEDHCRGIYAALTQGEPGGRYCFGGNAERTNLDVVTTICATLDKLSPRSMSQTHSALIRFVTDRPGHDRRYAMDDSNARAKLNYTNEYTFEQGLEQTIQWYLDNQVWCQAITAAKKAA
ncbi:MAG: dTDP-glucose 4,6-dehydratase [Rickettsiales bacterium]|nr:dTDP-glucose 4,6-dehydratase [Rickettsiales bacterium]